MSGVLVGWMGPKVEGIGLGVGLVWVENKGQKIFVLEKRERV